MENKLETDQVDDCESSYDSDSESGFTSTDEEEDDLSTDADSQTADGDCSTSKVDQSEQDTASQGQSSSGRNNLIGTTFPALFVANRSVSVRVIQKNKEQPEAVGQATQDD